MAQSTTPEPYELLEKLNKDSLILDAGCGDGRILKFLTSNGFNHIVGFDIDRKKITQLKKDGFIAEVGNVLTYKKNGGFDCILLMGVLSLLTRENRKEAIKNLSKSLNKGGFLYIEEFKRTKSKKNIVRYKKGFPLTGEYGSFLLPEKFVVHHFSKKELIEALNGFGLTIKERMFQTIHGNKNLGFQIIARRGLK